MEKVFDDMVRVSVLFVDFGNRQECTAASLYIIPKNFKYPFFAIPVSIEGSQKFQQSEENMLMLKSLLEKENLALDLKNDKTILTLKGEEIHFEKFLKKTETKKLFLDVHHKGGLFGGMENKGKKSRYNKPYSRTDKILDLAKKNMATKKKGIEPLEDLNKEIEFSDVASQESSAMATRSMTSTTTLTTVPGKFAYDLSFSSLYQDLSQSFLHLLGIPF